MMNTKRILPFILFLLISIIIHAQSVYDISGKLNTIKSAVPFLTIAPDSRAGSMGDEGVASTADINSQHWNPAKYMFMKEHYGLSISYTPWLFNLLGKEGGLSLAYVSGYYKFKNRQAISTSLRYFDLGAITLRNDRGEYIATTHPNEFAFDAGYSRLFSDYLSGALVFRYIRSDIAGGAANGVNNISYNAGNSVAADLAIYYQHPIRLNKQKAQYAFGVDISNIGTKLAYSQSDQKEFIPTNLRIGGRLTYDMDDYNKISLMLDLNKMLVPTPPIKNGDTIIAGRSDNVGTIEGMIQSFYDAPRGFNEELEEIAYSVGAEYWYRGQFAVRGGYFAENKNKGNRKYATVGVGLQLNVFNIDFSYLIPAGGKNSPLANTVRFTLGFTFK
jgi:hypothetical protein